MDKLRKILEKYKSLISYGIFGVLTTIINVVAYVIFFNYTCANNILSNIIAWVLAVAFAFVTNKIWVFDSKSFQSSILLIELIGFVSCRLMTGLIDLGIMYYAVDILHLNNTFMKCISNIIVIIVNYIASKVFVFKKRN